MKTAETSSPSLTFAERAKRLIPKPIVAAISTVALLANLGHSAVSAPTAGIEPFTTANALAQAMDIPANVLVSASVDGVDTRALGVVNGPFGNTGFPLVGNSAAMLSTGFVSTTEEVNTHASSVLDGLNTNEVNTELGPRPNDLVRLGLVLQPPAGAQCMTVDIRLLSEEYPSFVGSKFNDAVTAQVGTYDLTVRTGVYTSTINAPGNLAKDPSGQPINLNSVFAGTQVYSDTGTAFNGMSSLLRLAIPVNGNGPMSLYFQVLDVGDPVYDTAGLFDGVKFHNNASCTGGITPVPTATVVTPTSTRGPSTYILRLPMIIRSDALQPPPPTATPDGCLTPPFLLASKIGIHQLNNLPDGYEFNIIQGCFNLKPGDTIIIAGDLLGNDPTFADDYQLMKMNDKETQLIDHSRDCGGGLFWSPPVVVKNVHEGKNTFEYSQKDGCGGQYGNLSQAWAVAISQEKLRELIAAGRIKQ
jgi:hypothetical protein